MKKLKDLIDLVENTAPKPTNHPEYAFVSRREKHPTNPKKSKIHLYAVHLDHKNQTFKFLSPDGYKSINGEHASNDDVVLLAKKAVASKISKSVGKTIQVKNFMSLDKHDNQFRSDSNPYKHYKQIG